MAWRLAGSPTFLSPFSVNATMDGVVRRPSLLLGITTGSLPSITATQELVVPRSIPIIFPISLYNVRILCFIKLLLQKFHHQNNINTMLSFIKKSLSVSKVILVVSLCYLTSCGGQEQPNDIEQIKQKISDHKQEIVETNKKIAALEEELERLGGVAEMENTVSVTVSELTKQPFSHYVKVNGSVEAVNEATISPETNGQIKAIAVKKGERVTTGQVVARLNTSVIENNIREVETNLELAKTLYERQKNLWEQKVGSEVQFLQAKNNYESLQSRLKTLESQVEMSVIKAPFNGIVDNIFAKEGELAMPGMPLMQIINLDNLYVNADVSESFLAVVQPSEEVILRFPSYPDFEKKTRIHRIGNVINPENRTFRLQLLVNNQQERFKPNMVASISFRSFSADSALVVPSILIKQDVQGHFVFTARRNGNGNLHANKVYIERGLNSEGKTMIKGGLKAGDLLIISGHNQVTEGAPLNVNDEKKQTAGNN
jgi:membrane fusion protein, multidrug efflux system